MRVLALIALLPTAAMAYESPDQPVVFSDAVDVWSAVEFDTGALPQGSPVTVRFFIDSNGGALTDITSASELAWPDPLEQTWESQVEGGWFALITDLGLTLELSWDVFGVTGTEELWSEGLYFEDEAIFDGLLLPQGSPEFVNVQAAGGSLQDFSFYQSVVTGVEVGFRMDLIPAAEATLTGERIDVTDGSALIATDYEGDVSIFDVPASHPGWIELLATYYAQIDATLSLILRPAVDVCVIGQCFELAAFDIPIDLIDTSEARAFAPVTAHHPLPSLVPPDPSHDFGEVLVGNTDNLELPLSNQGEMYLEGWVEVVDPAGDPVPGISVYPEYFYARPGETDGAVVSFSPEAPVELTALLRITSNDPLHPEIEIPLRGLGADEEELDTSEDGYTYEGRSLGVSGCGCAQASPWSAGWLAVLLPLAVRRRR